MKIMRNTNIAALRGITSIFWLGFFMAISFMEAPLKFTAPNLSLADGLQIGKIVFGTLNHCEWVFMALIIATCLVKKPGRTELYLVSAAVLILVLETIWLLPALDLDANKIIAGKTVTGGALHWYYVALEIIKVPVLLLIGLKGIISIKSKYQLITI
jgi:hypothetical protein